MSSKHFKKNLILGDSSLRWQCISSLVGVVIAVTVLVLMTGCASQTKPLPMYQQVEVSTVKAYQDNVNHTQNYVYRADNTTLLKALSQNQSINQSINQ